jgi:hypothetical protein
MYLSTCSFTPKLKREISSVNYSKLDLVYKASLIKDMVATREINGDSCDRIFDDLIDDLSLVSPDQIDVSSIKKDGQQILNLMFEARSELHSALGIFPNECKLKLKKLFKEMRKVEDYIGVIFYNDPQISADTIIFEKEPIPVINKESYHPFHLGRNLNPNSKFEFKNGDILITKGVSFVSSTISSITTPASVFSHIVFVHVDKISKSVTTMESYVGKGVAIYPIDEALKNENARILVLRPKDQKLASEAADYMFSKIVDLKKKNKFIPYDYELNFEDNSKLSCEEVAYDSFKSKSGGAFIIPELMSSVKLNDEKFLERIGLKKGNMMTPADMETDSRFEIALDWTDYRIMRDSWRKDIATAEMFNWINEYKYRIHEDVKSIAARVIWSTRYIPGVWGMMAKISGIPKDYTKDVPGKTIATMASLKGIGSILLSEVKSADEKYYASTGMWMTELMLKESLEKFREQNPEKLNKLFRP